MRAGEAGTVPRKRKKNGVRDISLSAWRKSTSKPVAIALQQRGVVVKGPVSYEWTDEVLIRRSCLSCGLPGNNIRTPFSAYCGKRRTARGDHL